MISCHSSNPQEEIKCNHVILVIKTKKLGRHKWQILVQPSTSYGYRFPLNSASFWITTGKERLDLRCALGLLAYLQRSRLLSLIVVVCVGKRNPQRFHFGTYSFQKASVEASILILQPDSGWRGAGSAAACTCMCEVDGLWSCKATLFTQHKHLSSLTNASLRSPRTPQHQTFKQHRLGWCRSSTCRTWRWDWRRPRRQTWLKGSINHLHAAQLSGSCRLAGMTKTQSPNHLLSSEKIKSKILTAELNISIFQNPNSF